MQAEIDEDMTVRCLNLETQGLPSSYIPIASSRLSSMTGRPSKDTCYSDVLIASLLKADRTRFASNTTEFAFETENISAAIAPAELQSSTLDEKISIHMNESSNAAARHHLEASVTAFEDAN